MRKIAFWVSHEVGHKPGCTATEDGQRLGTSDRGSRGIVLYVAKTNALISCQLTTQLICAFVFAYAKTRLSHDAVHLVRFHFPYIFCFKMAVILG